MKTILDYLYKVTAWQYALAALLYLHLIINILWIVSNNAAIPWDSSNHSFITLDILDRIKHFDLVGILKVSNYYPIAVHTFSAIILLITGVHIKLIEFLGTVYFLATLVAIFLYVRAAFHNERLAFFTTLFFSLSPIAYNWSRFLMLDIPSVGALFAGLYFLERSDKLRNRSQTICFFVCAALLAMTKWTGLAYLTLPAFLMLWYFLRTSIRNKAIMLGNLGLGLLVFLVIAGPWYLVNFKDLTFLGEIYSVDHSHPDAQRIWHITDFLDYIRIFIRDQVTPIPALVFLASVIPLLLLRVRHSWYILGMFFFNLFLFSLLGNKDSRFTMHVVVFAGLSIFLCFEKLHQKSLVIASVLYSLLITFMIGYFFVLTLHQPEFEYRALHITLPILDRFEVININNNLVKGYDTNTWEMDRLLADLTTIEDNGGGNLLVVSEWEHLNPSNIRTYATVNGLTHITVHTADIVFLKRQYNTDHFPNQTELENYLRTKDYMLIAEDNVGSPILLNGKAIKQLQLFVGSSKQPACTSFQIEISPPNTTCIVPADTVLQTGSDIIVNNIDQPIGIKIVAGFAIVSCKWGCSFGIVKQPSGSLTPAITLRLLRTYTLPNQEKLRLYKIDKIEETSH